MWAAGARGLASLKASPLNDATRAAYGFTPKGAGLPPGAKPPDRLISIHCYSLPGIG